MYDVVILGGGPGGYAAALYAHNFDLSVAVVEKDKVGGTCLHRGCIPAKAWLHAAEVFTTVRDAGEFGVVTQPPSFDWSQGLVRKTQTVDQIHSGLAGLMKQRKIEVVEGYGRLAGPNKVMVDGPTGQVELEGKNLIIASGSVPRTIPGYEFDGHRIVSSDHALDWPARPNRVAVVGAGAIGCEFASLLVDLGAEVHLFEVEDQIVPGSEPRASRALKRALEARGVDIHTGTAVESPQMYEHAVVVPYAGTAVEVDTVLVAVGRAPLTEDIGLDTVGVELDRGYVKVNTETMETSQPGVYAVGDLVAGTPQLAHSGFAEGISAISYIATGEAAPVNFNAIPLVVYTHPELASVGLTEAQAKDAGLTVTTSNHSFGGVARAIITGQNQGTVKIVAVEDGPIIGATVVGPAAGELIHELMYAVGWEALPSEAAAFIHAHPTLAESVGEALLSAAGRSLH